MGPDRGEECLYLLKVQCSTKYIKNDSVQVGRPYNVQQNSAILDFWPIKNLT